jgi:hypothetical protein
MKKIMLIGDSIRNGYDLYVKESMEGVADVRFPSENCRFASYILRFFHVWCEREKTFDFDAVHWNTGLWDTLRIYGDECLVPIDEYERLLERIAVRIKRVCPNAVQIFATSTPVLESGYIADYEMRYNADVERYNEVAVRVMERNGVLVNDLYALMKDTPDSYHSDQTHFYTAEATRLMGDRVNSVLCGALGIDPSSLTPPDPQKFVKTQYKNDNQCYIKRGDVYVPVQGI